MARVVVDIQSGFSFAQSNVVQFANHIYQGNTFRSGRSHIDGAPVLIGRIQNRYEVVIGDDVSMA